MYIYIYLVSVVECRDHVPGGELLLGERDRNYVHSINIIDSYRYNFIYHIRSGIWLSVFLLFYGKQCMKLGILHGCA